MRIQHIAAGTRIRSLAVVVLLMMGTDLLSAGSAFADEEQPILAEEVQLDRPVEFERDVYPILEANCIACHNLAVAESQLILENVGAILKGGSLGPAIVAGKPEESLLYQVAARVEEPVMPPWPNDVQAKKLTPLEVGLLKQWILEGAVGGSSLKSMVMNWQPINEQLQAVYSVDLDNAGRFVAAGRGGIATVYDLMRPDHPLQLIDDSLAAPAEESQLQLPAIKATHRDYVHSIAFHPDGNILATSGYREVKLWKRVLDQENGRVALPPGTSLAAIQSDGPLSAFATSEPGIVVVDTALADQRTEVATDNQPPTALRFLIRDPAMLLIGLADGRLQLVEARSGTVSWISEPLESPALEFSEELDGRRLAALCSDGVVRLLELAEDGSGFSQVAELRSEQGSIAKLVGQGSRLLTVCSVPAQAASEGGAVLASTVEVWNIQEAARVAVLEMPLSLRELAVHVEQDRAVFVLQDGQTVLWSVTEGKQIAALSQELTASSQVQQAERQKALRDARSAVLKTRIDETEKELTAQKEAETKAKTELDQAVAAAAEGKTKLEEAVAATAAARAALEAAPEDEAAKAAIEPAEKAETAAKEASTAADSRQQLAQKSFEFASAAVMRAEKRVEDRKQQQMQAQQEADAAATGLETAQAALAAAVVSSDFACFIENGSVAVTIDQSGTTRLWKSTDGTPLEVLPAIHSEASSTGPVLALDSSGTTLWLRSAAGETEQLISRDAFPGWQFDCLIGPTPEEPESVFVDRVLALAFSPDGALLAAGGGEASRQGQLTLWSIADRSLVRQFTDAHSDTVYGVEFSPDGRLLASASADKFAKVFDVESGRHVQSYEGHTHHVMDVSWKGDLTLLASAGADNAIKVWNAETGEQTRTISTYSKQVTSLTFVGLENTILSSSGDRRVFLHNAGDGKTVREFSGSPDYVYRAAATPDGRLVAAGCEDGILRVWNGTDGKEVVSFKP